MPLDIQGTFVSQKINKIRWVPEDYVDTNCFITGSWNDEINYLKVWILESTGEEQNTEYPRDVSKYEVKGDVTEIKFVDKTQFAVSSSDGTVKLLQISPYDKSSPLKEVAVWDKLHKYGTYPCSCTALDELDGDVVSVGEDGSVNILNTRQGDITRTIIEADSCSIHSVCYLKHNEIITGNLRGHMKIWDLRSNSEKPSASFLLSGDQLAATCIVHHPTQHHILLAGSESGSLAVWDLRIGSFPASLLTAHESGVNEMKFHPENPKKLLTCSSSGDIWDWNMDMMTRSCKGPDSQEVVSWLPLGDDRNMMVNSLMSELHKSINTFDCHKSRMLCGTDNEAVYLILNLVY